VLFEYRLRCADPDEGGERAATWLYRTLGAGPLRRPRSEDDDARIVRLDQELRLRLAPVFNRVQSSASRNAAARPIVESVLGRPVSDLSLPARLDSAVADILQNEETYSVERRSKAARRYRERHADALALYLERRYRIALRADDATLADVGFTRAGLLNELKCLRRYIAGVRTPRPPARKSM
jgi:hypothetical protein